MCPACKAEVATVARACRFCRATLRWDGGVPTVEHPQLHAIGAPLLSRDFRREPLPGTRELSGTFPGLRWHATAAGAETSIERSKIRHWTFAARMRDTFVRTFVTAHDANAKVGVVLRRESLDAHFTQYLVQLHPGRQAIMVAREWEGPKSTRATSLADESVHRAIVGPGQPNEIAVAAYGGSIQVWVNHVAVVAIYDSALGIGATGLVFSATEDGDARATFASIEVGAVSA
jgi:hypothetical protein